NRGDTFSASQGVLTISGGTIYADAEGDGLDSNGSIVMTGGTAIVNGPTKDGNGALDYDGTFKQSGGFLVAAGSAGMAQAPSEDSAQRAILMTFPSAMNAGILVTLTDSAGAAIATFAPAKTFRTIVFSSPSLKAGETYTISTGGTSAGSAKNGLYEGGATSGSAKVVSFTLGDKVTYVNQSGVTTGSTGGGRGQGGGFAPGRR
ncbi:MAG: carbohydrate-binding protein, partial [Paenibacillus sp.]|nr:carbohydrate-binding protein [Paenibacillus sp.]